MNIIKELRPVEALYIISESEKKNVNEVDAIFSTLIYLVNENYLSIMDGRLYLSHKAETNTDGLRIYEKSILNSIHAQEKIKVYYTIKNFDFKEFLYKKEFFKKETKKTGTWILKFSKTKYTPTDKYYEALDYLNSLKMNLYEKQELYRKHNSLTQRVKDISNSKELEISSSDMVDEIFSTDNILFDLHHLKSYVFAFHEFISNFTEISRILEISDIALICRYYADASYQSVMSESKCDACKACKDGKGH